MPRDVPIGWREHVRVADHHQRMLGVAMELNQGGDLGVQAQIARADQELRSRLGMAGDQASHNVTRWIRVRMDAEKQLNRARVILSEPAFQAAFRKGIAAFEGFEEGDTARLRWPVNAAVVKGEAPTGNPLPDAEGCTHSSEPAKEDAPEHSRFLER